MRKRNNKTLREYFARYWKTYQETEECDEKFALNIFKYGLQKDKDSIYLLGFHLTLVMTYSQE